VTAHDGKTYLAMWAVGVVVVVAAFVMVLTDATWRSGGGCVDMDAVF
jgi:hypothetical protein